MTAQLTFAKGKNNEILLAKFSNANLQNDKGMQFGLFEDGETGPPNKRKKRQLVAETDKMSYVGKNYGTYAAAENNSANYLVGVFDKKTNKVKIYNSEIFLLHPHFKDDDKDGEDEVDIGETYRAKMDALTEAFGVGKKKKAMTKRQQIQIGTKAMDTAMQSAVTLAMKEATTSADPAPQDHVDSIIPPHYKDATKPQEAYFIDDLISYEEMEVLKTPAQTYVTSTSQELAEMNSIGIVCSYVLGQLKILPVDPEARMRKACILSYVQYLVDFFQLKAADVKKRDFLPEDMPGLIKKKITNEFCLLTRSAKGATVRCMPPKMKDKVLMQILVIGLILDDFNFEFSSLLKDLKITPMRINKTLRALGCLIRPQNAENMKMAVLPIPLVFPVVNTPKKSRQK